MARIHRRSPGTWEVVLELGRDPVTGRRQRQTVTVRGTKRDAEREAARQVAGIAGGTYVDPSKETVAQFLRRWVRDYVEPSLALRTRARYTGIVETQLIPGIGGLPLQKLRAAHILALYGQLRTSGNLRTGSGLSPAAVRKVHVVLHRALHHAVAWQALATNPADAVNAPTVPHVEVQHLTPAQARALLAGLQGHPMGLPLRTLLLCGLRLSELLGLRWADVDWDGGRFLIRQSLDHRRGGQIRFRGVKSHRSERPVSVPAQLLVDLRAHRQAEVAKRLAAGKDWIDHGLVFTTPTGLPLSGTWLRTNFYRLLEQLELPHIRLHGLRHTMATLMLAAGEHPKLVSERLGHSSAGFTLNTYGGVIPGMHGEAAQRLERGLGEPMSTDDASTAR